MKVEANAKIIDKTKTVTEIDGLSVVADVPAEKGGSGDLPTPLQMWVAALLNCSIMTLRGFCENMEISTEGMELDFKGERDAKTGIYTNMEFTVTLPKGFPENYRKTVNSVIESCTVKKIMKNLPEIELKLIHD
jgi:uncharacterized OsmC-like protein